MGILPEQKEKRRQEILDAAIGMLDDKVPPLARFENIAGMTFWGAVQGVAETFAINPSCPMPNPVWISDMLKK